MYWYFKVEIVCSEMYQSESSQENKLYDIFQIVGIDYKGVGRIRGGKRGRRGISGDQEAAVPWPGTHQLAPAALVPLLPVLKPPWLGAGTAEEVPLLPGLVNLRDALPENPPSPPPSPRIYQQLPVFAMELVSEAEVSASGLLVSHQCRTWLEGM